MNDKAEDNLADYYRVSGSWTNDRASADRRSQRIAWTVAATATAVAALEAIALVMLTPLKTVEPYTLLVDRHTGYVEALKPLERHAIPPDAALVRSFLVQYVIAREGFDIDSLKANYRKVALWSAGDARSAYIASMQATNPASQLATLPRRALIQVEIRSISPLDADTALVRFSTTRTDPGGQARAQEIWASVIKYRFSGAAMSVADRLTNPLGFQVMRYHRDAEILSPAPSQPSTMAPVSATPPAGDGPAVAPASSSTPLEPGVSR